jgi:hypothetical protein
MADMTGYLFIEAKVAPLGFQLLVDDMHCLTDRVWF